MAISQVTIFSFLCIKIHQTYLIHDPRRWHPYSNSDMVGYPSLFLMPILVNKKICSTYKSLRAENQNISKHFLPPDTHPKFSTAKENYESLSRSFRVSIAKDTTISSSKSLKSHVKIITYMNNDNSFNLLIDVVFSMINQLIVIVPKD